MLEQIINPLPWMMMHSLKCVAYNSYSHQRCMIKKGWKIMLIANNFLLHNTPRAIVYARLVYALQQLNEKEQAQFWLDEGKRLFPRSDFFAENAVCSQQQCRKTSSTVKVLITGTSGQVGQFISCKFEEAARADLCAFTSRT